MVGLDRGPYGSGRGDQDSGPHGLSSDRNSGPVQGPLAGRPAAAEWPQSMWTPEIARLMISRWISEVPSKIV